MRTKLDTGRDAIWLIIFFVLITFLLQPWRNSVSQDDATYASAVLAWNWSHPQVHPSQLASAWPQIILGASVAHLIPLIPGRETLALLNTMTWVIFVTLAFITHRLSRFSVQVILSFFLFPLWLQYGISFLSDVYAAFFLVLILLSLKFNEFGSNSFHKTGLFLFPVLLTWQRQTMVAFPFFWTISLLISSMKKEILYGQFIRYRQSALLIGIGVIAGICGYFFLPMTPIQKGLIYWRSKEWMSGGDLPILDTILRFCQMCLASGVFLLPWLDLSLLKRRQALWILFLQLIVFLVLWRAPAPPLSWGVFFLDYFNPIIRIALISFGVWGFSTFKELRSFQGVSPASTIMACLLVLAFYTYQQANDIRYGMILILPFILHFSAELRKRPLLGGYYFYFIPIGVIGLLLNLYNLNTTEMRWKVAQQLKKQGVPIYEISAGYGHDLFYLGEECIVKALNKIQQHHPENPVASTEFQDYFLKPHRYYEYGWESRFTIKPYEAFGRKVGLSAVKDLQGKAEKLSYIPYSVLGIPNQLVLIQSRKFAPANCFR